MESYLEHSLQKLQEFEGAVPWMYQDTVGRVTVAVGCMLPSLAAAQDLPFQKDGRAATHDEIAVEFQRISGMPMGRPAHFYRNPGAPELTPQQMSAQLLATLTRMETELRHGLSHYDSLPDTVKMALLDMSYNLGVSGLLHGFPRLIQAVQAGNWTLASTACFRRGPSAARNDWTRSMFLANVLGQVTAVGEGILKRFGFGVIGMVASWFE